MKTNAKKPSKIAWIEAEKTLEKLTLWLPDEHISTIVKIYFSSRPCETILLRKVALWLISPFLFFWSKIYFMQIPEAINQKYKD